MLLANSEEYTYSGGVLHTGDTHFSRLLTDVFHRFVGLTYRLQIKNKYRHYKISFNTKQYVLYFIVIVI